MHETTELLVIATKDDLKKLWSLASVHALNLYFRSMQVTHRTGQGVLRSTNE